MGDPALGLEKEFANSTSLHGIARVANNTRVVFKLLWLAIILVCLVVCVVQIEDRFRRFFLFTASTALSVEFVGTLNFPAVTICNFNRYRKSQVSEEELANLHYIITAADYDYDVYYEGSYFWGEEFQDVDKIVPESTPFEFNYTEFTKRAGFILDSVTLVECEWRGKTNSCSATNFTHVFTSFGNCWTFNLGVNRPILKQLQAGSGNGLKVLIDIQQEEYAESINGNIEAGLKVLVHDQDTPPMIESTGLAIQPGVHAFIGVKKQLFLNIEKPYGKCDRSRTLKRFKTYTLEGCNIECAAEKISQRCDCRLVRHPGVETECSPAVAETCAKEVLSLRCSLPTQLKTGETEGCACTVPCNYTTFSASLSTAAIPNKNVERELLNKYKPNSVSPWIEAGVFSNAEEDKWFQGEGEEYFRNNMIVLDIYYEDINFQLYEQTVAISPSALISDIGGQLGLFLGASFITLAEIISYIGHRMMKFLGMKLKNKTSSSESKE